MRRRHFIALLASCPVGLPFTTAAQPTPRSRRIGFLANDPSISATSAGQAFLDGLRENGFVEGKNIFIERRFVGQRRDLSQNYANELLSAGVEVIVTSGSNNTLAAKRLTKSVPIVMINVLDPTRDGIISSLAAPEGNVTGVASHISAEMAGKRLQLLKEAVPKVSRLAILLNPDLQQDLDQLHVIEHIAGSLGVTPSTFPLRRLEDLGGISARIRREGPNALFGLYNAETLILRRPIADLALANHLPSMSAFSEGAAAGCLLSYGASRTEIFRRAARYVARILNGTKPADLPVEQPTQFELVVNVKTARTLRIQIPREILSRADEVIQ